MNHANVALLENMYRHFTRGEADKMLELCASQVTFQVPGKNKLSGKYDKVNFASGFLTQLQELTHGTFEMEIHDVLASDRHGTVLATGRFMHQGKPVEFRTVHVWRIENGKPVAGYEYPRDLYQFDSLFS